jgi:hypothetical protein
MQIYYLVNVNGPKNSNIGRGGNKIHFTKTGAEAAKLFCRKLRDHFSRERLELL